MAGDGSSEEGVDLTQVRECYDNYECRVCRSEQAEINWGEPGDQQELAQGAHSLSRDRS